MSFTPGGIKSSPFGNTINKNLLTPCRTVGLSRKRTTPNSISKILSQDLNNSNSSISENTPVNSNVYTKRKYGMGESSSLTNSAKKVESGVKKSLDSCFQKDENAVIEVREENIEDNGEKNIKILSKRQIKRLETQQKTLGSGKMNSDDFEKENTQDTEVKSSNQSSNKFLSLDEKVEIEDDVYPLSAYNSSVMKAEVPDSTNISSTASDETSSTINDPLVKLPLKRTILYDSDDEFRITENFTTKLKTCERKKTVDESDYKHTNSHDSFRDCSINIKRLSEQEIGDLTVNSAKKIDTIQCAKEDLGVIKKKRSEVMNEEDGFITKSLKLSNEVVEKVTKNKDPPKIKKSKLLKVKSLTLCNSFDDEEEAFTSTPDRERNEKRELISQIKAIEKSISDKKIKLENLKRASLYKSKHNVEELNNVTEIWRRGCNLGLEGLLKQLQLHGPMDMSTLLRNLQISQETASKVLINTI
ncbi:uncharacterized protein LOC130443925 [Diorhabda sublineata]|uniref:uncharacterized protein LOC130443925 n=1 Tax=Diorhabda sublineata TaxID=1163346 RepID=UPI0024E107AC|nr:uncharacterized protein LOC130443925 [Diorhabda sublineata]